MAHRVRTRPGRGSRRSTCTGRAARRAPQILYGPKRLTVSEMRSRIDAIEERIRETDWMLDGLPDESEHDASGLHLCSQEEKPGVNGSHLISLTATKPEPLLSPGGCASPPFPPG
jgi:hypothetical protein